MSENFDEIFTRKSCGNCSYYDFDEKSQEICRKTYAPINWEVCDCYRCFLEDDGNEDE